MTGRVMLAVGATGGRFWWTAVLVLRVPDGPATGGATADVVTGAVVAEAVVVGAVVVVAVGPVVVASAAFSWAGSVSAGFLRAALVLPLPFPRALDAAFAGFLLFGAGLAPDFGGLSAMSQRLLTLDCGLAEVLRKRGRKRKWRIS